MSYSSRFWTDIHEETLRTWKIELAVGPSAPLFRNQTWTWGALLEKLRGPLFDTKGLAEFYANLAGNRLEHVPERRGVWYPGVVSKQADAPEPVGGSLLVYEFEDADPDALSGWLETRTEFYGHAWCLFTVPGHAAGHPRLRFVAPLHKTISLHEWHGLHGILLEYLEHGIEDGVFSAFGPARDPVGVWPRKPGEPTRFFDSHSGIVVYADTILECHPGWEGLVEGPEPGPDEQLEVTR